MAEKKDVATTESKSVQEQKSGAQEPAIRPPVDIFEDETGITLQADMPGVSRERLDVHIDSDGLSIEGKAEIPMPEGMEAIHADVRSTRYQRSFSLSGELDGSKIDATLKDGVLTLRIPKREQFQPRKIEVRTG
ncbi:MAG: Hsp20/alpha crystallin family protein [Candidatus Thiodiazotropha taylori]|nr:Hsp20/alpha crystallin family protein [Candidatus Thiodiazotropha taylori]